MKQKISVALVGAGSMGGALLRGWLENSVIDAASSAAFDPAPAQWLEAAGVNSGLAINPSLQAGRYDALVIAVKPQTAEKALPPFSEIARETLTVSIMAGTSIASISRYLGGARKIVRAMPNLPAAVGKGASAIYCARGVGETEKVIAQDLMAAVGAAIWVDSESAIDAATAISGSGPAYFFLLGEALEAAARALGLDDDAARSLARATLIGAGAYAAQDRRALDELRRAVTSPGGTTEAALKIFDGDDRRLRKLVEEATRAAARRAGELTN
ncbi:MAG: pyrroline-5-carboxylate reductase [Parvularculaceae bacterium]|nr:pyrroline-5-carboxylate reductase [Parvularculaceae bacterium]